MLRRYFYTSGPLLSQWIQKNTMLRKLQDQYFRNALIAAKRIDQKASYKQLHQKIIEMTIQQQNKYANNYHIQCIFKHLSKFNQVTQCKNMIYDSSKTNLNIKDLVDPDKFPIWDNKQTQAKYDHMWDYVIGKLRYQLGYQLIVRNSKVQHPSGGKGVKIVLSNQRKYIQSGQFLGFVPGIIYQNYNSYKKFKLNKLNQYQKTPYHLHFSSGKILQLSQITLAQYDFINDKFKQGQQNYQKIKIDPSFINPYALGHIINHPPPGQQPNVYFTQMYIQRSFFPSYWLKYIPYQNSFEANSNKLRIFGIFALKQIKNNEQLFVNYLQNHIYPIDNLPDWYLKPTIISQNMKYLQKGQYQLPTRNYWKWLQSKYIQRNKQLWQKYNQNHLNYQPGQIKYQDQQKIIRKMTIRNYKKENQFE